MERTLYEQRCQISYYSNANNVHIYEVEWDNEEQTPIIITPNYLYRFRDNNIEGDITLEQILTHFTYDNYAVTLDLFYQNQGFDITNLLNVSIRNLPVIQINLYKNFDVFNDTIKQYNAILEQRFEESQQNIIDNNDNNEIDQYIDHLVQIMNNEPTNEETTYEEPTSEDYEYYEEPDYETIAHSVAEYVLN